jgi:hypothetical protein
MVDSGIAKSVVAEFINDLMAPWNLVFFAYRRSGSRGALLGVDV